MGMAAILVMWLDHLNKFSFPLSKEAEHKVWLRLAKRFQWRRCLKMVVIYMYIASGQGADNPSGVKFFINSIIQSIVSFVSSFPPLNDFVTVFRFKHKGNLI